MDINQKEILLKKMKRHHYSKTEITNKSITDLQAKMGWKGTGTEYDPIIISNLSGLKPNLRIHRSSLHYIIRDIVVYKLMCISTQNITIENCKINELELEGCYNMTIRNNSILWLKFVYSKGCTLENNSFSSFALERLESNYFDKLYPMLQYFLYCVISLLIIVAFLIFSYIVYVWPIGLLDLGLVALLFYVIHILKVRRKRTEKKPENILVGNSILSDGDKKEIFHKILENYTYLGGNWFKYNLPLLVGAPIGVAIAVIIYITMLS